VLAGAFCIRGSGLRGVGGPIDITGITASDGVQFIRREEVRRAEPELQMVGRRRRPSSPARGTSAGRRRTACLSRMPRRT